MMRIVNTTPMVLKHQIEEAIAKAVADFRRDYPNNKGFTRKCVLNMETMVNLLLSMQGGSLKKELYDAGIDVTASAFVQQRNKLSWTVFEDAFEHFNANCNDVKTLPSTSSRTLSQKSSSRCVTECTRRLSLTARSAPTRVRA